MPIALDTVEHWIDSDQQIESLFANQQIDPFQSLSLLGNQALQFFSDLVLTVHARTKQADTWGIDEEQLWYS